MAYVESCVCVCVYLIKVKKNIKWHLEQTITESVIIKNINGQFYVARKNEFDTQFLLADNIPLNSLIKKKNAHD